MQTWLGLAAWIDRGNRAIGRFVSWLGIVMIALGAYNAIVRYVGGFFGANLSSNGLIETQWYLFSAVFLLGAGATLADNGHVRVDVIYGRFGDRGKAWIDLVGTLGLAIPFCVLAIWSSWPAVANSWAIGELSPDPGGLPRYPVKSLIPIAFVLVIAQALALALRSFAVVWLGPEAVRSATSPAGGDDES